MSFTSDARFQLGAIIYRIMRVAKDIGDYKNRLRSTARIVADSAVLYTTVTVIFVVGLFLAEENSGASALHDVFDAVVCICPCHSFGCVVLICVGGTELCCGRHHVPSYCNSRWPGSNTLCRQSCQARKYEYSGHVDRDTEGKLLNVWTCKPEGGGISERTGITAGRS